MLFTAEEMPDLEKWFTKSALEDLLFNHGKGYDFHLVISQRVEYRKYIGW